MTIPRSIWFCKDTLLAHSAVGRVLDDDPALKKLWGPRWTAGIGPRLVVALVYESSQRASYWRPYLDGLGDDVSTPIGWSSHEIAALQNPHLEASVHETVGKLQAMLDEAIPHLVQVTDRTIEPVLLPLRQPVPVPHP